MRFDALGILIVGLAVVWAGSAAGVRRRRRTPWVWGAMAVVAALLLAAAAFRPDRPHLVAPVATLLAATMFELLVALSASGPMIERDRRRVVAAGVASVVVAAASAVPDDARPWVVAWWVVLGGLGLRTSNLGYRKASPGHRRSMQWVGWAIAVLLEVALVVLALRMMTGRPPGPAVVVLGASAVVPLAIVAGAHPRLATRVDRLLTGTIAVAGLTALVIGAYAAVILALGRSVRDDEHALLLLSMAAAAAAALAYQPLRSRLVDATNQLVYGEREAPDAALRTWGSRLTRAIPMDELLLQLCESLRKSMTLASAEVFTGADGVYELAAGVPHRTIEPLHINDKSQSVVTRAGVSGGTWVEVWLPSLVGGEGVMRVAPIAHAGGLLGLIVVTRRDEAPFSEDEDRVLTELARQVALALHNVQLDSALQASLIELQRTNVELLESRRRIVTAGDAERRKLERDLHDGAQQHLVAMAVKLRLAEDLVEEAPNEAIDAIAELRSDLKDAIAELRALAHGIFPPLLSSGGLGEALPNAAGRAALPTLVSASGLGRYDQQIESTVYFCCLEAMQNAGKHAGAQAEIVVTVEEVDGVLTFEVCDDGAGFEMNGSAATGHGFVNMADRLGTVGGHLSVESTPGSGTSIRGTIPIR